MWICPNCGMQNEEGSFCTSCGTPKPLQYRQEQTAPEYPDYLPEYPDYLPAEPQRVNGGKLAVLIVLAALALTAVGLGLFFVLRSAGGTAALTGAGQGSAYSMTPPPQGSGEIIMPPSGTSAPLPTKTSEPI